ncbi:acetyltransferase [Colletotrichum orchidophilum]|uniref:Acetyltransferase n=1 Tax=Colletotrichum orchidophilum TaxID=1209926 RepID=A0A1G4BJQ8_9PEZI|nr:acetyltransferase [Colletotrichum orchidophilum]OHF01672.1 acetyltransferase [Colletotrichum orchidophilum]
MEFYMRPLSVSDLDQCVTVETAAFPPAEAATREKIEYRLTVCPQICLGLFARESRSNSEGATHQGAIPAFNPPNATKNDKLIAHTISTKSLSPVVQDEDMSVPPTWKTEPTATYNVGHQPKGRTITLHSLAVAPPFQKLGHGKTLMTHYIEHMRQTAQAERISILTYDRLVSYYQKLGFIHYGKSRCEYAGVAWHDLAYEFNTI